MRRKVITIWAVTALILAVAACVALLILWSGHFSSRPVPSALEADISMKAYDSSTPSRYEHLNNPLASASLDLLEAGGHYEEHCAVCHGDDGSGEPKFEGLMYPRPSDLRSKEVQDMSDGQLYWVIKNGIRWSGMPAFGKPGDNDSHAWKIVAYVRHIPNLTASEKEQVIHKTGEPMDHNEHSHSHAR